MQIFPQRESFIRLHQSPAEWAVRRGRSYRWDVSWRWPRIAERNALASSLAYKWSADWKQKIILVAGSTKNGEYEAAFSFMKFNSLRDKLVGDRNVIQSLQSTSQNIINFRFNFFSSNDKIIFVTDIKIESI